MNVERQHRIFIYPWSEQIHVTLRRNDGFLHSFCIFFKSILFRKNLIRMKFILHKISFLVSIFKGGKSRRYFSIYIRKWCSYLHPFITAVLSLSSLSALSNCRKLSSCPIFCWINVMRSDQKRVVPLYMIYVSINSFYVVEYYSL